MDRYISLLFFLYVLGVVVSAVMKRARTAMEIPEARPWPTPGMPGDGKTLSVEPDWTSEQAQSSDVAPVDPTAIGEATVGPAGIDRAPLESERAPQLASAPASVATSDDDLINDDPFSSYEDESNDPSDFEEEMDEDIGWRRERARTVASEPVSHQRARALTPAKVREAVIFAEILAPPRALRPYRVPTLRD